MKFVRLTRHDGEVILVQASWVQFVTPRIEGDPGKLGITRVQLSGSFVIVRETVAEVVEMLLNG